MSTPDPAMYLAWGKRRPTYGDTSDKPVKISISERRSIRVYYEDPRSALLRTHDRVHYECSAWKLTLLFSSTRNYVLKISFDKFVGSLEHFNRDTLQAKLQGIFD